MAVSVVERWSSWRGWLCGEVAVSGGSTVKQLLDRFGFRMI